MSHTRKIAINTLSTYAQSLLALFVGLFSARWALMALGPVDLGLFGVVGSILILISFLNTALSIGVSRHYAHSIGSSESLTDEQKNLELKTWFNTALSAHLGIAILVLLIGWPCGEYVIHHVLNIPANRLDACIVVYRISISTAILEVSAVPFIAMYTAHQKLTEVAILKSFQSIAILILAWLLLGVTSDRLVFYAAGLALASASVTSVLLIRACYLFTACRPQWELMFIKKYFTHLLSYVGWKVFGTACVALRNGGIPVLINLLFGPVINAAFAIANRVSIQASSLSASMQNAFQPAIVTAEGKGDRTQMLAMSLRVCRLGSAMVMIFAIPLALEMHTVLKLWLHEPPPHTAGLCQWVIALLILDKMTSGAMIAVNAYGKIARYEIIQGVTFLIALPALWLFHKVGLGPQSIGWAMFISVTLYCAGRLIFAKSLVSFPISKWIKEVGFPVSCIVLFCVMMGYMIHLSLPDSLWRAALSIGTSIISIALLGYAFLLNNDEKKFVISHVLRT
jgi:O-antigen/teichoic acid export membrane protein